jgi:hypothetical protein
MMILPFCPAFVLVEVEELLDGLVTGRASTRYPSYGNWGMAFSKKSASQKAQNLPWMDG